MAIAGTTDEASGVNFDADNVEFDITYGQVHVTAVAAAKEKSFKSQLTHNHQLNKK